MVPTSHPPPFPWAVVIEAALYAVLSVTLALTAPSPPPALLPLTVAAVVATAAQLHGHPADALGLAPAALLPAIVCGVVAPATGRATVAVGWYVLVYGATPHRWRRAWVVEAAGISAITIVVAAAATAASRGGDSGWGGDWGSGWGGWGAADAAWAVGVAATVRAVLTFWDGSLTLAEAAAVAHAAGGVARRVVGGGSAAAIVAAAAAPTTATDVPAGVPRVADAVVTAALLEALLVGALAIPASAAGRRWWTRRRHPQSAPTWLSVRRGGSGSASDNGSSCGSGGDDGCGGGGGGGGWPGGVAPPWWVVTWYAGLVALTAIPTTWLGTVLRTRNPVGVVVTFLVSPRGHAAMLVYWAALLAAAAGFGAALLRRRFPRKERGVPPASVAAAAVTAAVAAGSARSSHLRAAQVVGRKAYHLLAVALFFPALVATPLLLAVASAAALALFLAVEAVRAAGVPPGGTLTRAMGGLLDDRDAGAVVTTHMTLLVGCVLPLWLRLPPPPRGAGIAVVGLAAVGVGDAVAAVVGVRWGRHRWAAGTTRSMEGSAAGWGAALGLCVLWVGADAGGSGGGWGRGWAAATDVGRWAAVLGWVSAMEAVTGQIDNLVLGAGGVAVALLVGLGS
ncbi:hypothetical protein MMPV_009488 [Pyropia vietnamensis]